MFQDILQWRLLSKINVREGLVGLEMTAEDILVSNTSTLLKEYEVNAVVPDFDVEDATSVESWHNAARQILSPRPSLA
jgi:hypothetical protein